MPYTAFFQDDNSTFGLPRSQQQKQQSLLHRHPLTPQRENSNNNYIPLYDDSIFDNIPSHYDSVQSHHDNIPSHHEHIPSHHDNIINIVNSNGDLLLTKNINNFLVPINAYSPANNPLIRNDQLKLPIQQLNNTHHFIDPNTITATTTAATTPITNKIHFNNLDTSITYPYSTYSVSPGIEMTIPNSSLTAASHATLPTALPTALPTTSSHAASPTTSTTAHATSPSTAHAASNTPNTSPTASTHSTSPTASPHSTSPTASPHRNNIHENSSNIEDDLPDKSATSTKTNKTNKTISKETATSKDKSSRTKNINTDKNINDKDINDKNINTDKRNNEKRINNKTHNDIVKKISKTKNEESPFSSLGMHHLRMLISNDEASRIIGLKGQALFKLKIRYDVAISISQHEKNCSDRILFCSGYLDNVSNAMKGIVDILINTMTEDLKNKTHLFPFLTSMFKKPQISDFNNIKSLSEIYSIRLIVSNSQLSAIIGKDGHTIKLLISKYNIKIIASKRFLPDSDERILELQGTSKNIAESQIHIGKIMYHKGLNKEHFGERHYHPHIVASNQNSTDSKKKKITSNKFDDKTDHNIDHKTDDKIDHKTDDKIDHKSEDKIDHTPDRKIDHTPDRKIEDKTDHKINDKVHDKINDETVDTPTKNITKSNPSDSSQVQSLSNCSITSSKITKENDNSNDNKDDPNETETDLYTLSIEFPNFLVGVIMGVKGNRISNLRNLTKTTIKLERFVDPVTSQDMARFIVKSRNRSNVKKANSILKKNLHTELRRIARE
ncbi:hypothetical protein MOSE0_J03510 [Monosporozyma servazzii]